MDPDSESFLQNPYPQPLLALTRSKNYPNKALIMKTSQELRMLSSVTINCQVTKIVMNSGSQLSVL